MGFDRVRTVLFDAGNTLVHLDYAFIAELLAAHGQRRSALDVQRAEYTAKAAIDQAMAPGLRPQQLMWPNGNTPKPKASYFEVALRALDVPAEAMPPILKALHEHNLQDCLWRVVEPDTTSVLAGLAARGFTLGVVSNADGRIEGDLRRFGLAPHFGTVVDSHVVGVEKPDPRIFALALERLGADAASTIYVGDVFAIDVLGAWRAGLQAVLVDVLGCYPGPVDCLRISRLGDLLALLPGGPTAR